MKLPIAISCLIFMLSSTVRAEDLMDTWSSVPPTQSGLVFVVPPGLDFDEFMLRSDNRLLDGIKWYKVRDEKLTFVRQYRVPPGEYEVHVPGPIVALRVAAKPGQLVFVRLSPYEPYGQITGVSIDTWIDRIGPDVSGAITSLYKAGISVQPVEVTPVGQQLFFDTDPPWPIPPPPKKK